MAIKSLLHFDGADESTTFTDVVGVFTWSAVGGAEIGTAQSVFGGASLNASLGGELDQSNTFTASTSWTADCWARFNDVVFLNGVMSLVGPTPFNATSISAGSDGFGAQYNESRTGAASDGTATGTKTTWNADQWYHFEMTYDVVAGKYYFYVDGVKDAEITDATPMSGAGWKIFIGSDTANVLTGYIDEFRYTDANEHPSGTTFSPPAEEYAPPDSAFVPLPLITLDASGFGDVFGDVAISLPAKSLSTLDTEIFGTADMQLPIFSLVSAGLTGFVGNFAEQLPLFLLVADGNEYAELILPLLTLSASGSVGEIGDIDWLLPVLSLSATGTLAIAQVGQANNVLPLLQLLSASLAGETGSANLTLGMLRLVARGSLSNAGAADLTLPLLVTDGLGWPIGVGTVSMLLPMLQLIGVGYHAHIISYHPWALNMRKGALSQYENFNFNSFAKFNNVVLAADENGIHVLGEQENDDGTDIDALIRTGNLNYEVSYVKRVPRIYTSYKSNGDLEFRTITTHGGTRAYLLPGNGNTLHQQRRVPIGRGPKSAYWQFEIANRDGSDFSIDNMIVYPEVTKRRVI